MPFVIANRTVKTNRDELRVTTSVLTYNDKINLNPQIAIIVAASVCALSPD